MINSEQFNEANTIKYDVYQALWEHRISHKRMAYKLAY